MQFQSNNVNESEIRSVKFTYNEEIRRFTMKPETSFNDMVTIIRSLIHVNDDTPLVLKYLDDENEWVTVEKDIEFQCALSITGNPIKFCVSLAAEVVEKKQWKGRRGGKGRGGKRGCKGKGRGKHCAGKQEVDETESLTETSEPKECKRKGRGGRGKQWKKFKQEKKESESDTVSSVDPTLTTDEIKLKIRDLAQHKQTVLEQLRVAREELVARKQAIKECRQVPDRRVEIPALRLTLVEAKSAMFAVRDELWATKTEIRQLKTAMRNKSSSESLTE